jgi:hypothetical protein
LANAWHSLVNEWNLSIAVSASIISASRWRSRQIAGALMVASAWALQVDEVSNVCAEAFRECVGGHSRASAGFTL